MADYRAPLADIRFALDHLVDVEELCELEVFSHLDPETILGALEENGRFVSDVIAPLNRVGDEQGAGFDPSTGTVSMPTGFKTAYDRYVEAGWGAAPFPSEFGGGSFPWLAAVVTQEMMTSANASLAMLPLLTQGAIDLLLHHGSDDQKRRYLPAMIKGDWTATMNLTEPEAGSDLGAIRTRAERLDDGTYRITGTKIFISYGEHDMADNIIHLVLARTLGAPEGTKGISCFIVPKNLVSDEGVLGERNDLRCTAIEHKMGIKASPTCVMSYGDNGGAVGYLVGEENQGMRYMFTMMNRARLSVGVQGLALAERSYQDALAYAKERRQGRAPGVDPGESSPIIDHPDVRRMLMRMRSLIEAMRAIIYVAAESMDLADNHPDPEIRSAKQEEADLLIPVAKAWCTEMGTEVTSLAIQVHGGLGYIEESGLPQYYRDVRIASIYEGTNGIQAIDLVGRKLTMRDGAAMIDFLTMIASLDPVLYKAGDDLAPIRSNFTSALTALADVTGWFRRHAGDDPRDLLAGATPYLRMFSLVVAGWLMARQAISARTALDEGRGDAEALQAKIATARFFHEQILPEVHGLTAPTTSGSELLFSISPDCLQA